MEPGELELRKAFEQVATNNIKTISDYTTETRKLVRELQEIVKELKNLIAQRDNDINELRRQISVLQGKVYVGGTH